MNGADFVADTNALLYLLCGNECMRPYLSNRLGVSIISEMELLSFPQTDDQEEENIRALLRDCTRFPLDNRIKSKAILLRKQYRIKLPDAIIVATALENALPFLSADKALRKITELDLRLLEPTPQS
ncbi:MAG: type II toxin-antitoxin system VapC family toxin [Rhodocyclaceae bacterium]|nr:type II toxin-antitoxin system VapC family toxin [Rhodocyclaceae bacterium]